MSGTDDRIYLPVGNVRFDELYDWSDPKQQCRTHVCQIHQPRLQRRLSITRSGTLVEVNEVDVAVFRYGSQVFAIQEKCPHAGGPLHVGDIEELPDRSLCIRCPWHSWRWDLKTGKVRKPTGRNQVADVYPVEVREGGTIWIGFDQFCPAYFTSQDF